MLGEKIRLRRRAKGWTQEILAENAGLSQPYVAQIEKGVKNPRFEVIVTLADVLGLTLNELRGEKANENNG